MAEVEVLRPAFATPVRFSCVAGVCRAALLALALIVATASASSAQQWTPSTDADMVRRLTPTVVAIRVVTDTAPESDTLAAGGAPGGAAAQQLRLMTGSGFVVDPSGVIVTNEHVIHAATEISVTFADGESRPARVLGAVRMLDLAVLQIDGDTPRPAVRWGDSSKIRPGDETFAYGNPLAVGLSVTAGIVSAIHRDIGSTPFDDFIQTDAVINHGNSGGPLLNFDGEVIGVDTSIISPTSGYAGLGFAIPGNLAQFAVERVRRYGWLRPGWIGIQSTTVGNDMAEALGMARAQGTMIGSVAPGSPAAKAGLRVGDVIMRFGDLDPPDDRALLRAILMTPPGDTVPVALRRAGKEMMLPVVVAEWPRADYDLRNGVPTARPRPAVRPDLGLTLSAVTDAIRARHELSPRQTGVVVVGVMAGTDAWSRGIAVGDVIERVQDVVVTTGADVQGAIDRDRARNRRFALFLVRRKDSGSAGPRWMALRIGNGPNTVSATK